MKRSKPFSSFLKQVPLMVALLAAFVFSAGNSLRTALPGVPQQVQEQQEENERPVAYLDYAISALAPVASFIFSQSPFVGAPLPALLHVEQKLPPLPPLRADRYFRTLFRLIISPNAP